MAKTKQSTGIKWESVRVKLGDLVPWEHNPRMSSKAQARRIIKSFEDFGQVETIAVSPKLDVYDGHQRLSALLTVHGDEHEIDARKSSRALTEAERERLVLMLHNGATGAWDWDALSNFDADLLAQSGFDDELLKQLNRDQAAVMELLGEGDEDERADAEPQTDRAAELREKWGVESGQLWALSDHRLLCGDSTKAEDVARVMGGEKADAVVTDPPYGVGVQYATFKDTEANTESVIDGFMPIVLAMECPIALTPGVPVMWSYPQPAWVMVWVHPAPVGGCSWGFAGVNPILVYGKDPYLAAGMGRQPDHIVMAADREGVEGHPTPKPIKVWSWLVERLTTKAGQIVYEPFNGSGTTIIACEQLGRRARAIEISPDYVAVALQRFFDATGKTPELVT